MRNRSFQSQAVAAVLVIAIFGAAASVAWGQRRDETGSLPSGASSTPTIRGARFSPATLLRRGRPTAAESPSSGLSWRGTATRSRDERRRRASHAG